ncbi:unnamed protein product [Musa textilis]
MAITFVSCIAFALPIRCHVRQTKIFGASLPRPVPRAAARPTRLGFRLENAPNFDLNRRVAIVFASDSSNTEPTANEKVDNSSNVGDGPPLPTILAGVVVFLLFCWAVGSIVLWLVGLIVNPPSS